MYKKSVIVTGGAKGIGAGIAKAFAEKGYNVLIVYRTSEKEAEQLAEKIGAKTFCADVRLQKDAEAMTEYALSCFGNIDVLVNNAGIAQQKLFTDITGEEWDNMFAVNVKGAFNCSKAVMPHFIHKKEGCIINISSIWGITGASCEVHYSASKAAVIGLTKALAKEVAPSGIRVNCIAPGIIETDMLSSFSEDDLRDMKNETPLLRLGKPADIARSALYLACDSFMTGQIISPNGGIVI